MTAEQPCGDYPLTITSGYCNVVGIDSISDTTQLITTTGGNDGTVWIGDSVGADWTYRQPEWTIKPLEFNYQWPNYDPPHNFEQRWDKIVKVMAEEAKQFSKHQKTKKNSKKKGEFYIMKRLVQVMVVDPDKRVPDEKSVVHMGTAVLTSLADEDLLLEVDMKGELAKHNEIRAKIEDEDRSDKRNKSVYLKPVKVSDLEVRIFVIQKF